MSMVDKVIQQTLGLTPEDMAGIKDGIQMLKESGPDIMKRLEMNELRVFALCAYCKAANPEAWAKAEEDSKNYYRQQKAKEAAQMAAKEKAKHGTA